MPQQMIHSKGGKTSFRRITVTLPQETYGRLIGESSRRKIAGEPNQLISALLREAVGAYLERLPSEDRSLGMRPINTLDNL